MTKIKGAEMVNLGTWVEKNSFFFCLEMTIPYKFIYFIKIKENVLISLLEFFPVSLLGRLYQI